MKTQNKILKILKKYIPSLYGFTTMASDIEFKIDFVNCNSAKFASLLNIEESEAKDILNALYIENRRDLHEMEDDLK